MESQYNRFFNPWSNLPNENSRFNYLNELREQFSKFENEVWNYNSLRPNEAFKIDLKLPLLLIETFAKLFRLWKDFAAFQKLIKAELFHQINDEMNAYFGADISQFELHCDTCDGNIVIEKNDLKYSYELHTQEEHHQRILNDLNYLICPSSRQNQDSIPAVKQEDTKDDFNGYIIVTSNNRLECTLCDRALIDEQEAIHHVTNWSHRLKGMQFSPDDTNYIVEIDGKYYCRLCRRKVNDNKQYHADHLASDTHKELEECRRVLKENESQVTMLNYDTGEFMCESCDVSDANWKALLKHCRSSNHRRFQLKSTPTPSESDERNDFILFNNNRYECLLCQCPLERWEIAEHKRNKEHMQKYFGILNNNETVRCISSPSVLDSSSESDGYNDAFKNNDIYIEINLKKDDSEVFKCVLCNTTGKGLDNLDAHCLTALHQKHKKMIEKVSKVYADCDVNEEPLPTIKDLDDLYYCRVCDVLIEDSESVAQHKKEKSHIQSEKVQKVLDENRVCISVLSDEPVKLYHCQLCSRTIDGDSNIVGHGTSMRHTQLLNTVKTLSRNRSMRTIQ